MIIKAACALFGFSILTLMAMYGWGELRFRALPATEFGASTPVATLSEQLSEGLIEAQIYVLEDLKYRIDVQFSPDSSSSIASTMPPEVNLSMESMHMDGYDQPLELIGNGAWRSEGGLPMAGVWIMNVGYGDEFAEAHFTLK
jgi:hypothetical protein